MVVVPMYHDEMCALIETMLPVEVVKNKYERLLANINEGYIPASYLVKSHTCALCHIHTDDCEICGIKKLTGLHCSLYPQPDVNGKMSLWGKIAEILYYFEDTYKCYDIPVTNSFMDAFKVSEIKEADLPKVEELKVYFTEMMQLMDEIKEKKLDLAREPERVCHNCLKAFPKNECVFNTYTDTIVCKECNKTINAEVEHIKK